MSVNKITRTLMTSLLALAFVQVAFSQNVQSYRQSFQGNGQPQAAYYQQFTCSQPKQRKMTTILNVLGSILSNTQGISSRRGFNNGLQAGFTVVSALQEIQASKTNGAILVCFVPVQTGNYPIP